MAIDLERGSKKLDLLNAYRQTFLGPEGKAVFEDLKRFCNYNKALYTRGNQASVNEMLIQEGKRIVFLRILKMLEQADVVKL